MRKFLLLFSIVPSLCFGQTYDIQNLTVHGTTTFNSTINFGSSPVFTQPVSIPGATGSQASGNVGEIQVQSGSLASGSLNRNAGTNITSMSVPAGDWDVYGWGCVSPNSSNFTWGGVSLSTTSATPDWNQGWNFTSTLLSQNYCYGIPVFQINSSSTTTLYLVVYAAWSTFGTTTPPSASGYITIVRR